VNKTVKRILIGAGAIVGIVVVFLALFMYKFSYETKKMSPLPTKQVVDGVYSVQDDFVNLYVVKKGGSCIVIDGANSAANVAKELKTLKIDPDSVDAVFLTHTDADHTAAITLFKKAKVYISAEEEQMLDGRTHRMFVFDNTIAVPYETLADGQTVKAAGLTVKGILTPGHTPGSMCYLVEGEYLFTGDILSLRDGSVELFNEFFNMDSETEKTSWKKISTLPGVKYIFTAHYGYTDKYRKAFEKWNR
jgi:glyoxylase-like metal-dependent hydrolase (beta-lactamase superfamily II)